MQIVIDIVDDDYNRINSYPDGRTFYPITARLYKAVKDGTPLPKTGHWIKEYKKSIFTTMYRCSECAILCGNNIFNYCPKCGAKMEREE